MSDFYRVVELRTQMLGLSNPEEIKRLEADIDAVWNESLKDYMKGKLFGETYP